MDHVQRRFMKLYPQFTLLSLTVIPDGSGKGLIKDSAGIRRTELLHEVVSCQDVTGWSDQESGVETLVVKVHVLYLACLQILVKMNPKAFHSEWPKLLGNKDTISHSCIEMDGFVPLAYFVVHDTSSRVRHAAAASISTLIEGPAQRAYLGLGEDGKAIKSFISLSQSLGQTIVSNVETLNQCILSETDDLVCCSIVRALTTFLSGCSWKKLPHIHFWSSIQVLHHKIGRYSSFGERSNELLLTCVHSLAMLLALKIDSLADDEAGGYLIDNSTGKYLSDTLASCVTIGRLKVKLEATLALRGMMRLTLLSSSHAARLYPLVEETRKTLEFKATDDKSKQYGPFVERLQQQLVLFVGDLSPHIHRDNDFMTDLSIHDVCTRIIIPATSHTSPRVRAAGFMSIVNVPSEFWDIGEISERIASIIIEACADDSESIVRSSAMKAYDFRIQYLDIVRIGREVQVPLIHGLGDSVLAVRIPSAVILETACNRLWQSSMEHLGIWRDNMSELVSCANALADFIPKACEDHEKVKVHGIHALGYLMGTRYRTTPGNSMYNDSHILQPRYFDILETAMAEGSLAVKWASYESCRIIILSARLTASAQGETDESSSWKDDPLLQSLMQSIQQQADQVSQHLEDGSTRSRMLLDQVLMEFS